MPFPFRFLLPALLSLSALPASAQAQAPAYPSRPITIIVPVPPGGIVDMAARMAADPLAQALGQPVVVDNRAGASGNIAYALAAAAQPDGYTLLASYSMYHAVNPALFSGLKWNAASFKPVAMVAVSPHVVVVHPSVPVHSLPELVAYARQNPGRLSYASQGSGSVPHVGTELLKQMSGIDVLHVPYKGSGPAIQDVLAGRVELFITTPPSVLGHIQQGKLRAIAIAGGQRHPLLPDVPTSAEQGFADFKLDAWVALFAPAGTPDQAVGTLARALASALSTPQAIERARQAGISARYQGPAALATTLQADTAHWGQVVRQAGIKVD